MEAKKQHSSSSSSFTNELFGSKESSSASSSSSSSGLFNSIFPNPSQAQGTQKNYDFAIKRDSLDKEDKSLNPKMDWSPFYQQQQKSPPWSLSSSIHYGGQDIYTNPPITKNPSSGHSSQKYNQEGEDDGRASRGNWWKGSLYY